MKRQRSKTKEKKTTAAMTLVDCYYIPTEIAQQFQLLREHCATEVQQHLQTKFPTVVKERNEEIGEVLVAYDEAGIKRGEMGLSPTDISKLEKEISADRLEKYLENFYQ